MSEMIEASEIRKGDVFRVPGYDWFTANSDAADHLVPDAAALERFEAQGLDKRVIVSTKEAGKITLGKFPGKKTIEVRRKT